MNTQLVLNANVETQGGVVVLYLDMEYSINEKGDVTGSSDDVCRARVFVEVQRNDQVIARKMFGQYILDSDNTADELFDLTEISNAGIVVDNPGSGNVNYKVYTWVDQVEGSANIVGFVPVLTAATLVVTELKR